MFKKLTILKDVPRGYTCGFGYDELHDDYKLACIFSDFRVEIYSLKSKSWRRIDDFKREKRLYFDMPKLVNGKLHWVTIVRPPGRRSTNGEIEFIDLVDEKWGKLDHPFYEKGKYFLELGVLGSDLCMFCCYDSDFGVVWVMKEYGVKESWAKIYTIKISNSISDVWSPLFSMSNKGDFLLVFRSAFMIYNPKDGSIRSFEVANFNSTFPPFFYVESLVCPFGDEPRT